MSATTAFRRLSAAALLLLALPLAAQTPAVLATYAYPKYDRAAALQPLADALSQRLAVPVAVRLFASPRALAAALRDGQADLVVTNTFAALALQDLPAARALAVFEVPAATAERYRGVLLARAADGPVDAAALARTAPRWRLAQAIPGSTSGGLVQDLHLAALGQHAPFAAMQFAGTHENALAALQAGQAHAAALADAPWREALAREPALAASVRELWRSPPIPPGPLVCREGARLDCAAAQRVLLGLHRESPAVLAALAAAWSEAAGATRLVAVDPRPYRALTAGFPSAEARRAALQRLLGD